MGWTNLGGQRILYFHHPFIGVNPLKRNRTVKNLWISDVMNHESELISGNDANLVVPGPCWKKNNIYVYSLEHGRLVHKRKSLHWNPEYHLRKNHHLQVPCSSSREEIYPINSDDRYMGNPSFSSAERYKHEASRTSHRLVRDSMPPHHPLVKQSWTKKNETQSPN